MIKRQFVLDRVRAVFERWGFDPLETPAFENWKLLAAKSGGGEEIKKEIYYFKDKSKRELGLRFDLTVPMARVLATNPNIPKPFKRYQIGRVWRYDRPGSGRYREFWQADVDIIGSKEASAEAEVIAVTCDAFKTLGFKNFMIRLSNRKVIESLVVNSGVSKRKVVDVFRSIDKLDKIGVDGVRSELRKRKITGDAAKKILKFIKIRGKPKDVIKKISKLADDDGVTELESILKGVAKYGYQKNVMIDLSLVRGLDYYTGPIFEVSVEGGKWSLAGGGRYDKLIESFGGRPTPATGISLGIERIIEVMSQKKMFDSLKTKTDVFVAAVNDSVRKNVLVIAKKLREAGLNVQTDVMNKNLKKQLERADTLGIPFTIIVGPKEVKKKKYKLRNMKSRREKEVSLGSIIKTLVK